MHISLTLFFLLLLPLLLLPLLPLSLLLLLQDGSCAGVGVWHHRQHR
jgi:hypothetical protein